MRRGLLRLGRALWYPVAGVLGLLGLGPRPPRRPWQPPADASHPLWQAVRERREHPGGEQRSRMPLEVGVGPGEQAEQADLPPAIRQLERAIRQLEQGRSQRRRRLPFSLLVWLSSRPARRPRAAVRQPSAGAPSKGPGRELWQAVEERRVLGEGQGASELRAIEASVGQRPRRRRSLRVGVRVTAGLAVAAALLAAVVSSSAYFTSTGSGSGSASAGSALAVTIGQGTPQDGLYPGGSADVAVSISNPNTIPVRLPSLVLDTTMGDGNSGFHVSGAPGCTVAGAALTFSPQDNGGSGWTVSPGSTAYLTPAPMISMGLGADDACQGAMFTVYLTVGP